MGEIRVYNFQWVTKYLCRSLGSWILESYWYDIQGWLLDEPCYNSYLKSVILCSITILWRALTSITHSLHQFYVNYLSHDHSNRNLSGQIQLPSPSSISHKPGSQSRRSNEVSCLFPSNIPKKRTTIGIWLSNSIYRFLVIVTVTSAVMHCLGNPVQRTIVTPSNNIIRP